MLKKGRKLYSILHNKCPRCHEGPFWPDSSYANLISHSGEMYESCSHCGLNYFREIGFYYGAMYISYIIGIIIFLFSWGLTTLMLPLDYSTWGQVGIICGVIVFLAPLNYYVSRLLWINFFVKYDVDKANQPSINAKPEIVSRT